MSHVGSCHCGQVTFEVEATVEQVFECNCSHCSRKGYLLWFVPPASFKLLSPNAGLAKYTFNTHAIEHFFCARCGCAPFGMGTLRSGKEAALVNARCLEGLAWDSVKRVPVDGRAF